MTAIASTPVNACPLCFRGAIRQSRDRVHLQIDCVHCGVFELTDTARVAIETLPQPMLAALVRAVQSATIARRETHISLQSLPRLMAAYL